MAIGGPVIGLCISFIIKYWLLWIFNDSVVTFSVTLFAAYVSFYLAENAGCSGILAIVTLGLYMSGFGRTAISRFDEEECHAFWKYFAYLAETVIFLLAGLIVGSMVYSRSDVEVEFEDEHSLLWNDIWKVFILYLMLTIIRAVTIMILYPLLETPEYRLSPKEGIVLTYAGLRGAVGLTLALTVHQTGALT
eukprot:CAMPEP_0201286118 /NCGR_PEP_ID=MMETSP1317-20130820/114291_1 /ASSEMBLY_ACC=CAM_ASM_000770 /TAXON_ID=187299 /ORGANISM="Undescribed Undescribed, Strain Undescribed" /LENGTH=191 /DNA_ID=CAMNT_0047612673 /DNA_START=1 /DNA_END=576 /DNA_ORIENTATION=-